MKSKPASLASTILDFDALGEFRPLLTEIAKLADIQPTEQVCKAVMDAVDSSNAAHNVEQKLRSSKKSTRELKGLIRAGGLYATALHNCSEETALWLAVACPTLAGFVVPNLSDMATRAAGIASAASGASRIRVPRHNLGLKVLVWRLLDATSGRLTVEKNLKSGTLSVALTKLRDFRDRYGYSLPSAGLIPNALPFSVLDRVRTDWNKTKAKHAK